ncbi:MAG: hypothetical protein JJE52_17435 [Acidimicrobiia bacterium]|nr:hypothetical protein [Acidimicrobiia bacterium]
MTFAEPEVLTVEEARRRGASLFSDVLLDHQPIAISVGHERVVVVSGQDYEDLEEIQRDLFDGIVAVARIATDSGRRTTLDEIIKLHGITEEELAAIEE